MNKKQIVALVAALGLMATLVLAAGGCERTVEINEPQHPGAINVHDIPPEEVPDFDVLSPEELADFMNRHGLDENLQMTMPEGITEYEVTDPPPPPLITMPAGAPAQASEVYPLVRGVIDIFNSGRFYLRGRGTLPGDMTPVGGGNNAQLTIAADGNNIMFQSAIDWNMMMQAVDAADGGAARNDFGASRVRAATLSTFFGRQIRLVMTPQGPIFAFPDRNVFIDLPALLEAAGEDEELPPMDMELFDAMGLSLRDVPRDIPASSVTVGGREYLAATMVEGEARVVYYFYDGQLRRIEAFSPEQGETMILEVDEFHGNPEARLFTTQGMRRAPMADIITFMNMGGGNVF